MNSRILALSLALVTLLCVGCSGDDAEKATRKIPDKPMPKGKDAQESAKIIAQRSLMGFIAWVKRPEAGMTGRMVLKEFAAKDGAKEMIWVTADKVTDAGFEGTVVTEPKNIEGLKKGDAIVVKKEDVADWQVTRSTGVRMGGYTLGPATPTK